MDGVSGIGKLGFGDEQYLCGVRGSSEERGCEPSVYVEYSSSLFYSFWNLGPVSLPRAQSAGTSHKHCSLAAHKAYLPRY